MPRNRRTRNEDRARLIDCYERGEDFVALADTLGVKRTTAYAIIRRFQNINVVEAMHAGGRPKIIDNETLDFIVMLIEADPLLTLIQVKILVRQIWPAKPEFSVSTLSRYLDGELISLKNVHDVPTQRNSDAVKEARHVHADWLLAEGIQSHRVYIDETGFNLWTKRAFGRGGVGERVNRIVGGSRGRNVTVIAAVSDLAGMFYHEVHTVSVTKEIFIDFMTSVAAVLGEERPYIIMDNAPVHNDVQRYFPQLQIKYLPAYSPFLNPFESCFSVSKSYLKHYLNEHMPRCTAEEARRQGVPLCVLRENLLIQGVERCLPNVTREIVIRNYNHVTKYIMKCINRENIYH